MCLQHRASDGTWDPGVGSAQGGEELVGTWLGMSPSPRSPIPPFPLSLIQGLLYLKPYPQHRPCPITAVEQTDPKEVKHTFLSKGRLLTGMTCREVL